MYVGMFQIKHGGKGIDNPEFFSDEHIDGKKYQGSDKTY